MMHLTIFNTAVGCFAWAEEVFHSLFCIPMKESIYIILYITYIKIITPLFIIYIMHQNRISKPYLVIINVFT